MAGWRHMYTYALDAAAYSMPYCKYAGEVPPQKGKAMDITHQDYCECTDPARCNDDAAMQWYAAGKEPRVSRPLSICAECDHSEGIGTVSPDVTHCEVCGQRI